MTYKPRNEMTVQVIKDAITANGKRIITFHAHYPRIIHAEVMTHRVFSRNARSSRAVPVKTIIQEVIDKPFIPWHWGKNQKGMQADQENNNRVFLPEPYIEDYHIEDYSKIEYDSVDRSREDAWLWARDRAVEAAQGFADADYHKQIANRLLEPFSWIDTLITTTDLSNFYHLRDHKDAEPHFHDLASLINGAVNFSKPKRLKEGEWYLPYINQSDFVAAYDYLVQRQTAKVDEFQILAILQQISVARCARISYVPFDGNSSIEKEIERYNLLVGSEPLHASPAEHQAMADYAFLDANKEVGRYESEHLSGNLGPGFVQFRKTLKNECFKGEW